MTVGEKMAGKPAVSQIGCNVLVGQAAIHSPHLTHLDKKFISFTAPGGRIRPGVFTWPSPGFPYNEFNPVKDITAVPAPITPVDINCRLWGEKTPDAAVSLFFDIPKVTAVSGQISSQVRQTIHSE